MSVQLPIDNSINNPFTGSPIRAPIDNQGLPSPRRDNLGSPPPFPPNQFGNQLGLGASGGPNMDEEEEEEQRLIYKMDELVEMKRSNYIPPMQLLAQQSEHLKPLEVAGILGTKPVALDKTLLLTEGVVKNAPVAAAAKDLNTELLKKDGIFVTSGEESVSVLNIRRLEQRLMREKKKEWFRKDNGDLIIDNQMYNERMTRLRDVTTNRNPNLSIVKKSAYLSERENQKKTQYFKLDILIGKVYFTKHPLFVREDELAVELKELIKAYKEKADLTLIPHLRKQYEQLTLEYQKLSMQNEVPTKDMDIIEKEIKIVQAMQEKEKAALQELMENIYNKWEELKNVRSGSNFSSTTVRLNVRQYKSEENTDEFEFLLSQQEYSKATDFTNRQLPYYERNRRQRIAQQKVWINIYINGIYVGRTKKMLMEWPGFEVNFLEKFQIYLFRKPATIEFRIYMGTLRPTLVDTVLIDIPGENANTLTSSSTIYREKPFAKKVYTTTRIKAPPAPKANAGAKENGAVPPPIKTDKSPGLPGANNDKSPLADDKSPLGLDKSPLGPDKSPLDGGDKSPLKGPNAQAANKPQTEVTVRSIASGIIYYKAEWFGFGTNLPPPTIDKLGGKKQDGITVKNYYEQSLENLVDLNDPRNELAIQQLKKLKNQQMQELLKRDAMMPFSEIESYRHRLYKLKFQKIDLVMKKIPLTELEIFNNYDFMRFITEYEKEMQELEGEAEYQTMNLQRENLLDIDKFPYNQATRRRLVKYRKRLYVRQQQVQSEKIQDVGNILSLKSVINEFYFEEGINPIVEFFKTVFAQSGKLRPKRRTQRKIKAEKIERADILVHVVKGKDIPARAKAASQVKNFREKAMVSPFQTGYPGPGYGSGFMGSAPGFYPPQGGYGGYPNNMGPAGYGSGGYMGGGYPGGAGYPGPGYPGPPGYQSYPGPGGYGMGGMGSPGREPMAQSMIPGYPPGYQRPLDYDNNMNAPYRNERFPDDNALRAAMAGNPDTRNVIAGGLPGEALGVERVLPFLEVKLYDPDKGTLFLVKTETFEGTYPEWNDNLVIPIKFSQGELKYDLTKNSQNTRAILYFTLFDLVSSVNRNRESTNRYSVLIEKRYLGSFSIPMITLFQNPSQNAVYRIERPLFLFGYFNMKPVFSTDLQMSNILADPFTPTYVNLSIGMDPVLELPNKNHADYHSGGENPQLLLNGTNWLKNLKKQRKFATRNIKLWGEIINRSAKLESTFIPRFITPLPPPIDVIDEEAYIKAARYVALIPLKNDVMYFKDIPDIWCTCQEFIDIKAGDYEEHSILLCNYFMFIDEFLKKDYMKNYIVLGKAVPEGDTVYVVRRDTRTNDIELWNACTGDPYFFKRKQMFFSCFGLCKLNQSTVLDREVSDNECPFQEIGCVINNENVWVNIQDEADPHHVAFDIENKAHWMPFLGEKSYPRYFPLNKIETIQKEIKYEKTPTEFVQRLEKKIISELVRRIENERSSLEGGKRPYRTKWESKFGEKLKNFLLTSFESFKYRTRVTGIKSSMAAGQNITKSKEDIEQIKDDILNEVPEGGDIYGFPLNMPYTDIEKIWQEVKNTDIHNIQSDDVEYVLAVRVYPYEHYVLSVWIFVGVIFNKPVKGR